jgi:pimeloyl-ACP methyl ester carboxylesterase
MESFDLIGMKIFRFIPDNRGTSRFVLFSHATGIAALTYSDILQRWANEFGVTVFTYDARGHGENAAGIGDAYKNGLTQLPWTLCDDLKNLFAALKDKFPGAWSLAGHSLGGWLSLYAAGESGADHLVLLDMPLLPASSAFLWAAACALGQRGFHPLSRPARRRKRLFRSRRQAFATFKRSPFFRNWPDHHIENYIDANFETLPNESLQLRHDPEWEADLFESQPAVHTPRFLKMNAGTRKKVRVDLIAGSESRICSPAAIRYFHQFFPRTRWLVVPEAGHMFPFENTQGLMNALGLAFPKQSSAFDDIELKAV